MSDLPAIHEIESHIPQSPNVSAISNIQFTDLTGRFIQIRSSSICDDVIINVSLPPLWLEALEESGRLTNQLHSLIGKLELAQHKRILDVFDSDPELGASVDRITKQIVTTFKRCQQSLKDVCPLFAKPGASELTFCNNARKTYNHRIEKLSEQFKSLQKDYISIISKKNRVDKKLNVDDNNNKILSSLSGDIMDFDMLSCSEDVTSSINDIKARNYGLAEIISSLQDIKDITLQIASMTLVQGTMLDRIDYNLLISAEQTELATNSLKKRVDDDSFALLIIRNLLFFITFLTVLIIVKFTR